MKNSFLRMLTHPIIQLISFSWILVGSAHFGGPYLFFVAGGVTDAELYAIVGVAGIVLLGLLVFYPKPVFQLLATICCIVSLLLFFVGSANDHAHTSFSEILPLITLILFCLIQILVILKLTRWKNY